jgi:hypothetical protein
MTKAPPSRTFGSILRRVIAPQRGGWSRAAARSVLEMEFSKADLKRMEQLLDRSSQGALSPEEEGELDVYRNVGVFLSLMQSRARQSLKRRA